MDAVQHLLIRSGRLTDAAALAAFAERSFRDAFAAQNRAVDLALYLRKAYGERQQSAELLDPQVTTLVAEVDGILAGFAQLRASRPPECVRSSRPVELWRFYVDRAWHGRGVALGLMHAVLDAARARAADTLWLGVWEHNPRAQAFYRKCGFVDVGQQDFLLGTDPQTDRVMAQTVA
ncbi:MAG TPA: GNAT family N-acetyltransferase [Gemmatimonadales bacterium]|nr:GNAT family N-acetyltransferase [Gemmatimonadales bacterium]